MLVFVVIIVVVVFLFCTFLFFQQGTLLAWLLPIALLLVGISWLSCPAWRGCLPAPFLHTWRFIVWRVTGLAPMVAFHWVLLSPITYNLSWSSFFFWRWPVGVCDGYPLYLNFVNTCSLPALLSTSIWILLIDKLKDLSPKFGDLLFLLMQIILQNKE